MSLLDVVQDDVPRSHSPFKGVAGKQTFFERADNEKEYSQDDMSLKDQRPYETLKFEEEPYVPVAVAQKHICLMENDMRRMKDNYSKTMKDLEVGFVKHEEKTREIYNRTLSAWKTKARNKIKQFQVALKKAIDERNEIEKTYKERNKKQRIENERLEKEKIFLISENEAGQEEIQAKAQLLEEIKDSYKNEISEKDKIIDERETQIEKLKDEQTEVQAKFEEEKQHLGDDLSAQLAEMTKKFEEETAKREEFEEKCNDLQDQIASGNAVAVAGFEAPIKKKKTKMLDEEEKGKSMFDDNDSEDSEIQSITSQRVAHGEKATTLNIAAVGAMGGHSNETKELLKRIDKLEEDKAQMEEEKIDLAKAVNNLNELLKESRSQMKIMQQQIDDAEKQGAEIIPIEVAEERNKVKMKKKKKSKKKNRIRDEEEDENEDEDGEEDTFKEDPELKKMVEKLVPEEDREDAVAEAKRVMLIHSSKNEDLEKEIKKLSKENDILKKSLAEVKKRDENDEDAEDIENLQEENQALMAQLKNMKKKNKEIENELNQIKENPIIPEQEEDSDGEIKINTSNVAPVASAPCKNCPKLKETVSDLEEKIAILEEENLHLKQNLNKEEDKNIKLDQEISDLRKINFSSDKVKAKDIDREMEKQLNALMNENEDLKEQNTQLSKKVQPTKRLEVKLDKKDKEIEKLHQKIEKLEDKNDQLQNIDMGPPKKSKKKGGASTAEARQLKDKDKLISKLKSKLEKLEDRVETLNITAETRKEEIRNLHTINKEQDRELKAFKGDLAAAEKSKDRSIKKNEKIRDKEAKEAAARKQELEKKLEVSKGKMSAENERLKQEFQDMKAELEQRLKVLKDQSTVLNTQLDEAEQGIKQRDKEIKKLEKTIEGMKEQVGDAENLMAEHKSVKKQLKEITNEFGVIEVKYKEEVKKRKKLHNMIEDMKGKIRVFARARPMSSKEQKAGHTQEVTFPDEMTICVNTKNGLKKYNFDNCFGPDSTQEEVFDESVTLVQSAIDGFNVCCFAYGQTGSGKTFTIQGDAKNPGLTPRIFEELFTILDSMDNFEVSLSCYMVELYLENLKDLLKPKKAAEVPLEIKKNAHGMVVVEGAHEIPIESLSQANKIFEFGLDNRKTASTNMNATSSRSHLVFSIVINSRNKQTGQRTVGKLSLVDLAGSERVSKTGADKERLKEALAINKSLSALGNVISALGDGKKKHVPYRDNKLTMLMEDSLGGNAKTLMFVNVSPASYNTDETNTSLTYAKRVKNIKNVAVKNTKSKQTDKMNAIIMELQGEITRLEKKLDEGGVKFRRTNTNFNIGEGDEEEKEFDPDEE